MRLTERVHLVGSGALGFGLSHDRDCHVYLVNGRTEMAVEGKHCLFSGDCIFHGGKILATNVYDCDLQQYVRSLQKMADLAVDVLLPGHLCVALGGGQSHIQKALDCLGRMLLPASIL